jgi:hypothetical protein
MYVFGVDIPVVEVIFAICIIGLFVLFEITVILLLITYHMRNSKKLESQIGSLMSALARLNKDELKELNRLKEIEKEEQGIVSKLRTAKAVKQKRSSVSSFLKKKK